MRTKLFIVAAFFSMALLSCKKGTETKPKAEAPKAEVSKEFSVDMDVIAPKEDNFAVYYTEDRTINFTGDKAVWSGVKGQPESQTVTFNFPEEVIPTDIRFDFGLNKDQGDVVLEKFRINYYGKSFEAKGSDFPKYFIANDSFITKTDDTKGTITFVKTPGKFSTPFYYPHQALLDEIAEITK